VPGDLPPLAPAQPHFFVSPHHQPVSLGWEYIVIQSLVSFDVHYRPTDCRTLGIPPPISRPDIMRDPFPIPPIPALSKAVQPLADRFHLPTLPLHVHEVLGAALFYTFIHLVVSPVLSEWLFPSYYPRHSRGKKANWDAHVVSLVQSTLINSLALWVMWASKDERGAMDWQQRIWAYDGASGFIQAMAAGYFLWDLITTVAFLDIFGLGLLAHAASALAVYSFGFVSWLFSARIVYTLVADALRNRDRSSTTTRPSSFSTSSRRRSSTSTGSSTNST